MNAQLPSPSSHWKTWRDRLLPAATLLVIVLLIWHPELRLLVPFLDLVGLDMFVLLAVTQTWLWARPFLTGVHRRVLVPVARRSWFAMIFLFGIAGPWVDASLSLRFGRWLPVS